jgi:beta-lactamase class A
LLFGNIHLLSISGHHIHGIIFKNYHELHSGEIVRYRGSFSFFRWGSLVLVLFSVVLTVLQLVRFSRLRAYFPVGMTIASIPVGNLDRQQAADRLLAVFTQPIEVVYGGAVIQIDPMTIGFELDLDTMLAAADQVRTQQPFWEAFWDYLWGRHTLETDIPLTSTYSEERLRNYLETEIASRYDQPAAPASPVIGTVDFQAGSEGTVLDIDKSILPIENALRSTTQRTASLPLVRTSPSHPSFNNLGVLLKQTVELAGFDGIVGLYLADLQTGQEIRFVVQQGNEINYPPDLSFTASSTIKIPVMVSVFRRLGDQIGNDTLKNLQDMIAHSINAATDWLIETVIDPGSGPLLVTEDMETLGLENTFLAGYFYQGAPLLLRISTPGNQRTDVTTDADPYNQTTPLEMGMLLLDIYQCATSGNGNLIAAFPGEITQPECEMMIDNLLQDKTARLIEAGLPDGTNIAHKHGWVTDIYGIIHDMSDAAIVYTPGGNYVLSIYLYDSEQIIFDPANDMVKNLSRAVYNYYNLPEP